MNKSLYAKTLVIAIAASFLLMAGNGLGNSGQSNEVLKIQDLSDTFQAGRLDTVKLSERVDNLANLAPPINNPESVTFQEGFETEAVGDLPNDPPWIATETTFSAYPYFEDDFENDTVGQNPDSPPWTTVDGATVPTYWSRNMEDTTAAQNLVSTSYFMGEFGMFGTMAGDATVLSEARPAGAPAGTISATLTGGTLAAHFNEGTNTAVQSFVGPAGIENGNTVTTAYAGCWIRMPAITSAQFFMLYADGIGPAVELLIYNGNVNHYPGGTSTPLTTYVANTWYEVFIQYNEVSKTYSVWWNGVQMAAGSAWIDPGIVNIDSMIWLGGESAGVSSNLYIDNWMHFVPATGGAHAVDASNAWSYSGSVGTQSIYLDQNNYATTPASATLRINPPYAFGLSGASWAVRTSTTVANTNGATFNILDFNGRTLMAMRFSGGQIQYRNGAVWTNLQAFTANTEYYLDVYMDATTKRYMGIWIDNVEMITDAALVNNGAGIAGFRAEGTVSTQSEIYFDYVIINGWEQPGTVRVSDVRAHSGTHSARMWEAGGGILGAGATGGEEACDLGAYLGGDLVTYGEFWFWFYGDGTLGGGSVWLMDTTQTYTVTVISLGSDLTVANIPHPGKVQWVDDGYLVDGPTITANTWNNISIRYDCTAKTFEARWNGVLQGTYGFWDTAAEDAGIVFFVGEGPAAPCDWFFDDIGLWIDDLPATPADLRTYLPEPMPGTENWYTVDQDNAVQGPVTNTYTNIDEITPLDGATENVQETFVVGGGGTVQYTYTGVTQATNNHYAWWCDINSVMSSAGPEYNVQTEASNTNYAEITTSEDTRWIGTDPGNTDYTFMRSEFQIAQTPSTVTSIFMSCEIQGDAATDFQIWAVDNTGTWAQIGTAVTGAADTDVVIGRAITANCANYIVGGYLTWGVYQTDASDLVRVDRMNATIVWSTPSYYSLEHRWRTQNVPAAADVMELSVTASTSATPDDTFSIGYATVLAGPYTPLITVNSASMTTYEAVLPIMSGQFYINVADSSSSDTIQDTVFIDAISIYWQDITGITSANEIATAGTLVQGTPTGAYTLTNSIPADASAQQIAEVAGSLTTFINTEGFTSGVPPTGWTTQYDGVYGDWGPSATANAGGTAPEAMYTYGPNGNGNGRLIAGPFDTTGFTTLSLQFRHMLDTYAAGCTLRVQTSTDMVTWTNTGWSVASGTVNVGPALVTEPLDATENVGSATLYVAWVVTLNSYNIDYWYVDNCVLTGTPAGYYATYRYTMQNIPLNTMSNTLTVTARSSAATEAFNISWSRALAGPYTNVITVSATAFTTYTATLPVTFDGSFFIQVKDTVFGAADTAITSVYIDSLYVASTISPVNTSVNVEWELSTDDGAGQNDVVQYNVYFSDSASGGNSDGPFNYLGSVAAGNTVYRHYGEAEDLVNNIWYIVTAEDTHSEGWSTGRASKFNLAPAGQSVLVNGAPNVTVASGTMVALTANMYDDSSTWEDILKIDGAEWYANTDPGVGLGNAMTSDGAWDSITEPFTATIDTTSMAGNNAIYVRGHEATPGNTGTGWGATVMVWVNVTGGSPPYAIDLPGISAPQWVFVSFPLAISGNIEDLLNDATLGDGLTTWDVAKWYNAQDPMDPWKTYRFGSTINDMPVLTNTMGVWVHLTANGGDTVLTIGQIGNYPVAPVLINLYAGWNLVGYPSASNAMGDASLPGLADIVSTWQATNPYIVDQAPGAVMLSHGHAYWVHVTADCVWTVNP